MADTATAISAEQVVRLRVVPWVNVGPVTFRQLIKRFGTGRTARDAVPDLVRRGGRTGLRIATAAEAALARVERFGGRLVRHAGGRVALSH